jgi:undecaprenyl-diphosphatase
MSLFLAVPWRPSRPVVVASALVLLAIGVSRVYLGEHHPSDVVAGWLAGTSFICGMSLIPAFRVREDVTASGAVGRDVAPG